MYKKIKETVQGAVIGTASGAVAGGGVGLITGKMGLTLLGTGIPVSLPIVGAVAGCVIMVSYVKGKQSGREKR